MFSTIHLATDNVIAVASTVIALAALAVAVWEGVATRRHNRLSVAPRLSIRHHLRGSQGRFGLTASNDGPGPALVTQCLLEIDGSSVEERGDNGWESAITALGLRELNFGYTTIAPHGVIRSGETVWLLSTPKTEEAEQHIKEITDAFGHLDVSISYESVYRDKKVETYRR
jgi:hypothetical protein